VAAVTTREDGGEGGSVDLLAWTDDLVERQQLQGIATALAQT
jgi:hypothetical protein